jgi:small-conductance mechanosensitive channel
MTLLLANSFGENLFDQLSNWIVTIGPKIPQALLALLVGFLIIKLLGWCVSIALRFVRMPAGLKGIVQSLADALLVIFLIIVVLQTLGLRDLALVFSGAVAAVGLALGAGASGLASDILAGVFLAQDKDFNIGDEVEGGEKPTRVVI